MRVARTTQELCGHSCKLVGAFFLPLSICPHHQPHSEAHHCAPSCDSARLCCCRCSECHSRDMRDGSALRYMRPSSARAILLRNTHCQAYWIPSHLSWQAIEQCHVWSPLFLSPIQ